MVTGPEALRTRPQMEDDHRRLVVRDPRLPTHLMPTGWPRERARSTFTTIYDGPAEPALHHLRDVVSSSENAGPPDFRVYTVEELRTGVLLRPPQNLPGSAFAAATRARVRERHSRRA
jgi:DNA-binding transcriptional regulator PaaX